MDRPLVLVADDDVRMAAAIEGLLRLAHDVDVVSVANGEDAVAQAQRRQPDLILLDMAMPKLDGFAATRILRSDPRTATIPIVAVTGHVCPQETLDAGCDDVLPKPFDLDSFLGKVSPFLTQTAEAEFAVACLA